LKLDEIKEIFSCFPVIEYETRGFLGTFGRTENQRNALGIIDSLTYPIMPNHMKFIIIGVAIK